MTTQPRVSSYESASIMKTDCDNALYHGILDEYEI